ncbi:MAG: hypothetical protein RIS43_518, partial [Actinomycetota bacterium]
DNFKDSDCEGGLESGGRHAAILDVRLGFHHARNPGY